jgi:hypothetical protein
VTTIEPTTPQDVAEFFPRLPPWGRICALTVRVDGRVVGIGGYYYNTDGTRVAFVEASEADCKKYRLALAKAARQFFAMCEAHGVRRLCAEADLSREAAARWLQRLGFNEMHRTESKSYWQRFCPSRNELPQPPSKGDHLMPNVQEVYLQFKGILEQIDQAKDNPRAIQEKVAEARLKLDELLMPDKPAAEATPDPAAEVNPVH